MAETATNTGTSPEGTGASPPRAVERAISLIRKAEVKSVPRAKIKDFLKRKNLTEQQIATAYDKFFDIENLVEHCFESRPLGFSVVMDPQGKNAVVSSIQNEALETEFGLERLSRIVKVNDRWVEHKKHQDIIDYILDRECPITFSFRKRVHKRRGSLFKKVQRPSRSQPAQKSRGSMIVNGSAPILTKSRGSTPNVLKADKKSNLYNPNSAENWSHQDMDNEANEMKAMLAALTMQNQDLTHDKMADDEHLQNLSSRTKNVLHAKSTGTMDGLTEAEKQELGEFGNDMFDLWRSMDGAEAGGGDMDEEGAVNAYVIQQANQMRLGTSRSVIDLDDDPSISMSSGGGLNVPVNGRMRSASSPVYSNDALVELHKGSALLKYGRRGNPKFRMFQLSKDNKLLIWFSEKKDASQTRIPIDDMVRIDKNQQHDNRDDPDLIQASFTIIYNEDNESSLRLSAKNATEAYLWTEGLSKLIEKSKNNEPLGSIKHLILDKKPGLDLHRRQSLANLIDKKRGDSKSRDKSIKNIRRELKNIRKNYDKAIKSTQSKKFEDAFSSPEIIGVDGGVVKTLDQHNKELERASIDEILKSIVQRLSSLDSQVDGLSDTHDEMFEPALTSIKADAWNCSVDLVALQSKIKVLMANPVIL